MNPCFSLLLAASARAIVLVFLASFPSIADAAPGRPNILFVLCDNWSSPHAGILGDPAAKTPVFDRIAREGVLFTHAFCPVPSCSPTRSCILTGRAAHQLGAAASLWSDFPRTHRVFTETLREFGYHVGFAGKGLSPVRFKENGWPRNPVGDEFADLDAFLRARPADRPFFFWLGNVDTALHAWGKAADFRARLDPVSLKVPPEFPDTPEVRDRLLDYYAAVCRMDTSVGDAITELETRGLLDDTIVVYTSDNGWQMPRGLANCYDTGCRVPCAIRWGKNLTHGRTVAEFISLTDLTPTFLELAGLPSEPGMTGRSFAGLLLGRPSAVPRDAVFLERERHANVREGNLSYPIRGIRTKDFLYLWNMRPDRWPAGDPRVWFAVGDYGDVDASRLKGYLLEHRDRPGFGKYFELHFGKRPGEELFDLRKDPSQLMNVAADPAYAGARKDLRARVEQWMRDTADPRVDPAHDEWDRHPYFGGRAKPGQLAK